MEKTINFQELERCLKAGMYGEYKLCYIDDVPRTFLTTRLMPRNIGRRRNGRRKTEGVRKNSRRRGACHQTIRNSAFFRNPILRRGSECMDFPNPDYIPGDQTLLAYFTPLALEDQWGDDWDDAPYDCNAGSPYDHMHNEKGEWEEFEMLEVLFYLPK